MGLQIKKINIKGNPCIKDRKNYKNELFEIFLSLICVDDCDKEGNDIESTEYGNEQNGYYEENNNESFEGKGEGTSNFELNSNENYLNIEEELENDNELDEENDEESDEENNEDNNEEK